jgi:2-polyprenyl-3-methyl-5-hydroxy-6-metoxy-1,4-benzoquinol methylase
LSAGASLVLNLRRLFGRADTHTHAASTDSRKTTPVPASDFTAESIVDEHFVPVDGATFEEYLDRNDLRAIHHLVRYRWAAAVLRSGAPLARVLDLGSGDGYGTHQIARALPGSSVTGVDYDRNVVEEAARKYVAPNLAFRCANSMDWRRSIGPEAWDAIVCFDVLEHVPHRELLLEGVVDSLEKKGVFLFSTPSGSGQNVLTPDWVHHKVEYCAASLFDFLRRYFGVVLGQDMEGFPSMEVFAALRLRRVDYEPIMNPAFCREPIRIQSRYK